jgi:predicted Rdx family selenoprotein
VAAVLKTDLGVDTELVVGSSGEFTVWLDGVKVADKAGGAFPEPSAVVANVRAKLSS